MQGTESSPLLISRLKLIFLLQILEVKYNDKSLLDSIEDNKKTMKFYYYQGENVIHLEGEGYFHDHIHFHAPSEHTLSGKRFSLETHFVHRSSNNHLLVVAILGEVNGNEVYALEMFSKHLSTLGNQIPDSKID